jgi:hypothetical protein
MISANEFEYTMHIIEGSRWATLTVTKDGREYSETFPHWLLDADDEIDLCFLECEWGWNNEREQELWRRG